MTAAQVGAAIAIVTLEVFVPNMSSAMGLWYLAIGLGLAGSLWANSRAFLTLEPLGARLLARGGASLAVWFAATYLAVVVGVNVKFALGGSL